VDTEKVFLEPDGVHATKEVQPGVKLKEPDGQLRASQLLPAQAAQGTMAILPPE
jgi:hypothetical protein